MHKRGDIVEFRGYKAEVIMVFSDDLIQIAYEDNVGLIHIVRLRLK